MITLLAIILLVALVSFDMAKTKVFRPVRVALARRTPRRLRGLWQCHFCLSHHVAWMVLLIFGWSYPFGTRFDAVLTWAVVVVLAGPVMTAIDWAIEAVDNFKEVFRIPESYAAPARRDPLPEGGIRESTRWAGDRPERLRRAAESPPSN